MEFIGLALSLLSFLILLSSFSAHEDDNNIYTQQRFEMVENQIISRGIHNSKVIKAMLRVPRHKFVPEGFRKFAYSDNPLPIGTDQTISQPYIVALMTELLRLNGGEKVLEVGTGSGYQAAILAEIGCEVFTIEILDSLSAKAEEILRYLGYGSINYKIDDGYRGWPEHAPFDAIIVTAASEHIPEPLIQQLKVNGKMIIPIGDQYQELLLITKTDKGIEKRTITPVRFVPMTGEAQRSKVSEN